MPSLNTKLATAPNVSANYVLKATTSTTIGNSLIFDNGTNGVGFGTASPVSTSGYMFTTTNASTGSGYITQVNGTTALYLYSNASDSRVAEQRNLPIVFETNGSTAMTLTQDKALYLSRTGSDLSFSDSLGGMYVRTNGNAAGTQEELRIFGRNIGFFSHSGTRYATITSSGNVGIGGTAGSGRLQVWGENSSSANYAMYVYNSGGFGLFGIRNDGAQFLSGFTYGNTVSGGVRTLYIDSTYALGGISSVRASKKNIQEFNSDWIYNLKPVEFNYRKKDEEGNYTEEVYDEINYGLIAEDTAPVADFLINYNDKEDGTKEMIGIEYPRLITPLLKAIQDLNTKLQDQQQTINSLINR
jgi:hypothetical protein